MVPTLSNGGDVPHGVVSRNHWNNSPGNVKASTQTAVLGEDVALKVFGCGDYLGPPILTEAMAEENELLRYRRCKLVGDLCCQVKGAMRGGQEMAQHQKL